MLTTQYCGLPFSGFAVLALACLARCCHNLALSEAAVATCRWHPSGDARHSSACPVMQPWFSRQHHAISCKLFHAPPPTSGQLIPLAAHACACCRMPCGRLPSCPAALQGRAFLQAHTPLPVQAAAASARRDVGRSSASTSSLLRTSSARRSLYAATEVTATRHSFACSLACVHPKADITCRATHVPPRRGSDGFDHPAACMRGVSARCHLML